MDTKLSNAIFALRELAESRRYLGKPMPHVVTEESAKHNLALAEEFDFAAEMLTNLVGMTMAHRMKEAAEKMDAELKARGK